MAVYGDVAAIKRMLAASGTQWGADAEARIDALNAALSLQVEWKTGRSFGTVAAPEAVTLAGSDSNVLLLPKPLRAVVAIYRGNRLAGPGGNPSFALDLAGWAPDATAGLSVAWARDDQTFRDQPGSLAATVSGSAGGSSFSRFAGTALPVGAGALLAVSGDVLAAGSGVSPLLGIVWEDANHAALAVATEPVATPIPADWIRRTLALPVPSGAAFARVACVAQATQAGAVGQAWFDNLAAGDALDPARYALAGVNRQGEAWLIELTDGSVWNDAWGTTGAYAWAGSGLAGVGGTEPDRLGPGGAWTGLAPGPLTVVGRWADTDADTDVPADLVDAVNVLVCEFFKQENASASGFVGPDGQYLPFRDPWKHGRVAPVLEKYGTGHELVL